MVVANCYGTDVGCDRVRALAKVMRHREAARTAGRCAAAARRHEAVLAQHLAILKDALPCL